MTAPNLRHRRWLLSAVALSAVVGLLVPIGPAAAEPNDLRDARTQAKDLASQVEKLEHQVEVVGEDLAAAQAELGQVVSRQISASNELADLSNAAQASQDATNERVRALYINGGQTGLYATVLDSTSLLDVVAGIDAVDRVLGQDRAAAAADAAAVAHASGLQSELADLTNRQTRLEAEARTKEERVRQLLADRQSALSDAGAEVRRLTDEWRKAQAAAAAQRAAATLGVSGSRPTGLPPANTTAGAALRAADAVVGVPYVYAGNGPSSFDCSGLTVWAYAAAGIQLPRTSRQQWFVGPHPALADLVPGDLLFWANDVTNPASIHHVAIYVGDGWMIHAPHTGDVVRYAPVYLDGYIGATRPA